MDCAEVTSAPAPGPPQPLPTPSPLSSLPMRRFHPFWLGGEGFQVGKGGGPLAQAAWLVRASSAALRQLPLLLASVAPLSSLGRLASLCCAQCCSRAVFPPHLAFLPHDLIHSHNFQRRPGVQDLLSLTLPDPGGLTCHGLPLWTFQGHHTPGTVAP